MPTIAGRHRRSLLSRDCNLHGMIKSIEVACLLLVATKGISLVTLVLEYVWAQPSSADCGDAPGQSPCKPPATGEVKVVSVLLTRSILLWLCPILFCVTARVFATKNAIRSRHRRCSVAPERRPLCSLTASS